MEIKSTKPCPDACRRPINLTGVNQFQKYPEMENQKISQLTRRERFFQMAEKNPDLHLFKEEFDLDLEY